MDQKANVTFTQLRYFVEAAEQSSMTRAAENLLVAQSAISTAISQLESRVDTQLFVRRRSKGIVLTAAGEQLLSDARNLLAHLDEVIDSARRQGGDVGGHIRIACFTTLAPFVLPSLLADLGERYPRLRIDVVEADAAGALEILRSGTVELAISYDFDFGSEIDREVVAVSTPYVLLPADHPLVRRGSIELTELVDIPMVLLDLPRSREYFLDMLSDAGVAPLVRYRSASYETVRTLVARGHGFSILNQRPASNSTYDGAEVAEVEIAAGAAPLPIVLARLTSVRPTARGRVVAEEVRRHFAAK